MLVSIYLGTLLRQLIAAAMDANDHPDRDENWDRLIAIGCLVLALAVIFTKAKAEWTNSRLASNRRARPGSTNNASRPSD